MDAGALVQAAREALLLALALSLPIVAAVALVGFVASVLQAAVQAHDPAVGHLPRLLAGFAALALAAPWIARELAAFAERALTAAAR